MKAGSSIRKLGRNRAYVAIVFCQIATFLVCLSVKLFYVAPISKTHLGFQAVLWVIIFLCIYFGKNKIIKAKNAFKGAKAEEITAQHLKPLKFDGWKFEYNVPLSRWGDADIFLKSPRNNYFVIDVKGNKGKVIFNGKRLMLKYSSGISNFSANKNILKAVKGQALSLKNLKGVGFVKPILCFTNASVTIKNNHIDGVHVLTLNNLLYTLRNLDINR